MAISVVEPLSRAQVHAVLASYGEPIEIPRQPLWNLKAFTPPGPVAARYVQSTGPIDAICGPGGSGKTVASVFKAVRFAVRAMPVCTDGTVRVRLTVVRDNYRALYRTTLRTWFEWFPPDYPSSTFSGGVDRPACHQLRLSTVRKVDGIAREVPVDLTVDFFAVGDVAIEELLKGYETSCGWVNEADNLHERVVPFLFSRTGRYPSRVQLPEGIERPRLVMCDFNAPDPDHPLWLACERGTFGEKLEEGQARAINFFHQPSGLSKDAENRAGKSYAEYEAEARTLTADDVARFVHGRPGYARDGKPVYQGDFDAQRHRAPDTLPVIPGLPLHLGLDQGLSPAAVLFQEASTGQVRIYAELVPDHGCGAMRFGEMLLALLRSPRFRDLPPGIAAADPAGFYGADKIAGELSWAQIIGQAIGRPVEPAPSQEPTIRRDAVRLLLRAHITADTPAFLVDPACVMLIKGFAARYRFKKRAHGGFEDSPEKNEFSHPHDALQYGVLTLRGRAAVIGDAAAAARGSVIPLRRPEAPAPMSANFSPHAIGRW